MILITAAIVFCLDVAFDNGYQFIVGKAESVINQVENSDTNNANTTEGSVEENTTNNVAEENNTDESENTVEEGTDE